MIKIIKVSHQLVKGSTHALRGNYSQLNPNDWEVTRFTRNLDLYCFKLKESLLSDLKGGRNATADEVPWIAQMIHV